MLSSKFLIPAFLQSLPSFASAAACPFMDLTAAVGQSDGSLNLRKEAQAQDIRRGDELSKRQGLLGLGGGLLNGVLQPFSGALAGLDVPTPQIPGTAQIPDESHPYIAPGPTDVRGMCPTMNTLANHGYIDRSGITTFAEAANACQIAYGFGYDLCVFLSSFGLLAGGDLATGKMSIGGADARVPNTLGPALGLSHHGPFESDNSITRQDVYFGNQADFELDRWNQLLSIADANGGLFDATTMAAQYSVSYNESRSTNPEFNSLPIGLTINYAERAFVYQALSNGSQGGVPNFANVAPFFLNETFPTNWYKRNTAYSIADAVADILDLMQRAPGEIGENQGLGNFQPANVDLQDMSPAQLACFIQDLALTIEPGQFAPVIAQNFDTAIAFLNGAVQPFFASYDCNTTDYTKPGPSAGNPTPGVNAQSPQITNGVYQ